ncbi:MAG TPA: hypothetical protein VFA45_21220 [Actinomycetes bacterium]|nr:hypothetical protein [Actinomycetes bacterium]
MRQHGDGDSGDWHQREREGGAGQDGLGLIAVPDMDREEFSADQKGCEYQNRRPVMIEPA